MSLEFQGAMWLKYERKLPLVLYERTPRYGHGQPDILGVSENRYIYEIEIKRTVSDFRANARKPHIKNREMFPEMLKRFPKQFWYLVPSKLVEKIQDEVPSWAGLLTLEYDPGDHGYNTPIRVKSIKPAPTNNESKKLSLKECARLLRNIGNQMISLIATNNSLRSRSNEIGDPTFMDDHFSKKYAFTGSYYEWVSNPDYINFQI